jgi:hypothetical protein
LTGDRIYDEAMESLEELLEDKYQQYTEQLKKMIMIASCIRDNLGHLSLKTAMEQHIESWSRQLSKRT